MFVKKSKVAMFLSRNVFLLNWQKRESEIQGLESSRVLKCVKDFCLRRVCELYVPNSLIKQECIPVGCTPLACCPYLPTCTARGVSAPGVRGVCSRGCLFQMGIPVCNGADIPPPHCEQNSWHTLLKILPCRNFVAGGNNTFEVFVNNTNLTFLSFLYKINNKVDQHQTYKPVMVSVVSSNPTGGNFIFLRNLDANFVQKWQKCQICAIYENLDYGQAVTWQPYFVDRTYL